MEMSAAQEFLGYLEEIQKPTWIRYVVIPNLNDTEDAVSKVFDLRNQYSCPYKNF